MSIADEFAEAWNTTAMVSSWIACKKMTKARQQALRLRMADEWWADNWREALAKASPIPGLRGANERNWRASVDWFLRPGTVVKIMEGVYDGWRPQQGPAVRTVESGDETARKLKESREYSERAAAEWEAKGERPKLSRE